MSACVFLSPSSLFLSIFPSLKMSLSLSPSLPLSIYISQLSLTLPLYLPNFAPLPPLPSVPYRHRPIIFRPPTPFSALPHTPQLLLYLPKPDVPFKPDSDGLPLPPLLAPIPPYPFFFPSLRVLSCQATLLPPPVFRLSSSFSCLPSPFSVFPLPFVVSTSLSQIGTATSTLMTNHVVSKSN